MNDTLDLLMSTAREQRHLSAAHIREYIPQPDQSPDVLERLYARCRAESIAIDGDVPPALLPPAFDEDESVGDDFAAELDQEGVAADDPVRLYLREIGRVSLLTGKEETLLAQQVERGDAQPSGSTPAITRWMSARSCCAGPAKATIARQHLIQANLRLVVSIAKKYLGRG